MKSESQEQQTLVMRLRWLHPDIEFFSIPNGGKRNPGEARRLKLEGVEAGTPDLFFPEPRAEFHGLFIEMKKKSGGKVSKEQKEKHEKYTKKGYKVLVCKGADEAYNNIVEYLSL